MASCVVNKRSFVNSFFKKVYNVSHNLQIRYQSLTASKLVYGDYGDPIKVIKKEQDQLKTPNRDEVLFRMLAAPVNPADINTVQGKYPVKPKLPAIPGNEGVAEVVEVGNQVKDLREGDRIVLLESGLGTWKTHGILSEKQVFKIPKELGLIEAATLTVNPCTAYRMLNDFVHLNPGDTIIQNGANSACGQYVIQICHAMGVRSVNIVRNRPEINELKIFLTKLGATETLTEEELRTTDIFKSGKLKRPVLALNCVGGKNSIEVLRHLNHGGKMVTYGGMSREPVTAPTSSFIFKNNSLHGFWMTQWSKDNFLSDERWKMFNELIGLMVSGKLKGPAHALVPFDNFQEAIKNTLNIQGFAGKKYILDFKS